MVWIVREDGALIGLTYQAEHEVFAWHRHETQGNFKAVLALPAGREDTLFALVERAGVFGVERLAESHAGGDYSRAVFLDSALTYEGPPVDAVSGLGHLEGRRVGILADGAVMAPRPVVNGRVNLDWPAAVIVVGLEYTADLETMPAETTGPGGSTVGRKKQINEIAVLFHETAGAQVGTRFDRLETIKWRGDEPYGSPPRAFSGLRSAVVPGLAENQNFICLRSGEPTPLTVLAVMAKMEAK